MIIEVRDVEVYYGGFKALGPVSLRVDEGQVAAIVGPSGCGKTTLLNVIAGILEPSRGKVSLGGLSPREAWGRMAYVTQKLTLLPWKTALENVALPCIIKGRPRSKCLSDAAEMLRAVGLEGHEGKYPPQLSGGMAQRVQLARALMVEPDVMLLDEPFGALDAYTRVEMQRLLLELLQNRRITTVLVTHDVDEAVTLSDVVFVMSSPPGRIVAEIYIEIPRPRDPIRLRAEGLLDDYRRQIWNMLSR